MTPYEEGRAAFSEGKKRNESPYKRDTMDRSFWETGWDAGEARRRRDAAADLGKPRERTLDRKLVEARDRVRKVAKGATINGTYRMDPEPALEAFRADLLLLVGDA